MSFLSCRDAPRLRQRLSLPPQCSQVRFLFPCIMLRSMSSHFRLLISILGNPPTRPAPCVSRGRSGSTEIRRRGGRSKIELVLKSEKRNVRQRLNQTLPPETYP